MRISSPGGRADVRLAADANVLLSAVLGGRVQAVLGHPRVIEVLTAEATFSEVQEYAPNWLERSVCRLMLY